MGSKDKRRLLYMLCRFIQSEPRSPRLSKNNTTSEAPGRAGPAGCWPQEACEGEGLKQADEEGIEGGIPLANGLLVIPGLSPGLQEG